MTDRIDDLLAELSEKQSELRKCVAERDDHPSETIDPCMARAKKAFIEAVEMHRGQNSAVARLAKCTEGNIRLQRRHPDRSPQLNVIYAMEPDAMDHVADDIRAYASAKRRLRRAG